MRKKIIISDVEKNLILKLQQENLFETINTTTPNNKIKEVQQLLIKKCFGDLLGPTKDDGKWGPYTSNAVLKAIVKKEAPLNFQPKKAPVPNKPKKPVVDAKYNPEIEIILRDVGVSLKALYLGLITYPLLNDWVSDWKPEYYYGDVSDGLSLKEFKQIDWQINVDDRSQKLYIWRDKKVQEIDSKTNWNAEKKRLAKSWLFSLVQTITQKYDADYEKRWKDEHV